MCVGPGGAGWRRAAAAGGRRAAPAATAAEPAAPPGPPQPPRSWGTMVTALSRHCPSREGVGVVGHTKVELNSPGESGEHASCSGLQAHDVDVLLQRGAGQGLLVHQGAQAAHHYVERPQRAEGAHESQRAGPRCNTDMGMDPEARSSRPSLCDQPLTQTHLHRGTG